MIGLPQLDDCLGAILMDDGEAAGHERRATSGGPRAADRERRPAIRMIGNKRGGRVGERTNERTSERNPI